MITQLTNNGGKVTLTLVGRLDTVAAQELNAELQPLLAKQDSIESLVVDAEGLEYISSSGLRILLTLTKQYKDFRIISVQPAVYDVLNMTGFTKIMNVERALRNLSVDGCEIIGIGGVGTVYRLDDDTIIKVFREGTTIEEVRSEINMSKEAFVMGMPTAISFDVVKVGGQYGLVYELLDADTLSACIKREPERIDEFARRYAELFRQLHQIDVPASSSVPCAMENERKQVMHIRRYFPQESIDLLMQILDAIPNGRSLLHLDLQTKNAMVQNGELMLIDMGEVGYGHPLLDLGHAYSAMVTLVGDYEKIIGMPKALGVELWNRAIGYYLEGLPADVVEQRKRQIEVVSCVRNFSWLALSDSFPEEVVNECKDVFEERVASRRDYILDVCKTFGDWQI
ncbi:MAG: anti-sigma factor antagonist [Bacteroidaceae bacterium]|nr:anti-sigma factor antagonist [Bacteroidaceae bacterium]